MMGDVIPNERDWISIRDIAASYYGLAHEVRLRILHLTIAAGYVTDWELREVLDLSISDIHSHVEILMKADFCEKRQVKNTSCVTLRKKFKTDAQAEFVEDVKLYHLVYCENKVFLLDLAKLLRSRQLGMRLQYANKIQDVDSKVEHNHRKSHRN